MREETIVEACDWSPIPLITEKHRRNKVTPKKATMSEEPEILSDENGVMIRPALETLSRLRRGRVMDELSIELNRVVKGVKDCTTGKGGKVTLTLNIKPVKQHQNAVSIQAAVVGQAPEDPPTLDLMFYDDDGNLHTRNPNQKDIFDDGPQAV